MVLIFLILFSVLNSAQAQPILSSPEIIRIRMFRSLEQFPQIQNAVVKQIKKNVWALSGEQLTYGKKNLPLHNVVLKKFDGKFDVISILDFNEYLSGVVGNEMPVSWPIEALKAQAVVARSFALARLAERKNEYFHLESDQSDQVFSVTNSLRAAQAVTETDGVVLRQVNGKILKAYYHADCGGQTIKASDVWGGKGFEAGTTFDPWCASREKNKWTYEISKKDFISKMSLVNIHLADFSTSSKNQFLEFSKKTFSVQSIRQILGFSKVRSSIDKVEIGSDSVRLTGQGFGHGVGLCQWGSRTLANREYTYRQILAHYYPNAKLVEKPMRIGLNTSAKDLELAVSN